MMMPARLPVREVSLLLIVSLLAACGGDGSSNGSGPPHTIGGAVSGLKGSGLVLQDNGGDTLKISGNGAFTFATAVAGGNTFNVTVSTQPTNPSQTCTVTHGSGTVSGDDITNVAVTCMTNSFTVGGTVSGLIGSGLLLADNGANNTPIAKNGAFTFTTALVSGSAYSVTVATQPTNPPQTCAVGNASGTVTTGNISTVSVTCATNTYSVGGYVSGLAGSGLTLSYNGGAPIAVSRNGAFIAASGLAIGTTYSVALVGQPTNPAQTCVLSNGSGAVGTANVTSISVFCPQAVGQFAYVVTSGSVPPSGPDTLGSISVYTINPSSGALTFIPGSSVAAGPTPQALQFVPHASFAWSLSIAAEYAITAPFQLSGIYDYSVDSSTGLLSPVAGNPFTDLDGTTSTPGCGQSGPSGLGASLGITFDPSGTFGFVSNGVNPNQEPPQENGQIWQFTVDPATGAPTLVGNSGVAGSCGEDPPPVAIDPSGQFAYIGGNDLLAFTIGSQTGTLTPVPGSPYNIAGNLVTDPAGRFVYSILSTGISVFTINPSNGALTPVVGNPLAINNASAVVVNPNGQFAYIIKFLEASEGGGVYPYSIGSNGVLTPIAGASTALSYPTSFTIDPSGQFAYVIARTGTNLSEGIYAFSINAATSALTPVSGSPFASAQGLSWITVTN